MMEIMLAIAPVAASAVIWMLRLEGRLNAHEIEDKAIHEAVKESLEDLKQQMRASNAKLDRLIERRWDS